MSKPNEYTRISIIIAKTVEKEDDRTNVCRFKI
jgi:hypothetical protein